VAVPTLVKAYPPPVSMIVGDLSDTERLLDRMQLRPGGVSRSWWCWSMRSRS
jgi:KaiB domain